MLSTRYYTCLFPVIKYFDHHFLVLWHNFIKWKYSKGSCFGSKVGPFTYLLKHGYNPLLTKSKLLHGYQIMMTSWHDVSEILAKWRVNITHQFSRKLSIYHKMIIILGRLSTESSKYSINSLRPGGSDNGLSQGRCKGVIGTSAGILLIGPLVTNFSEILRKFQELVFKNAVWKMAAMLYWPQWVNSARC